MQWLFATVLLCGFPYAVWTFLVKSRLVVIEDAFLMQLPGMALVTAFFLLMLKSALVAKKVGETFGFGEEAKKSGNWKKWENNLRLIHKGRKASQLAVIMCLLVLFVISITLLVAYNNTV